MIFLQPLKKYAVFSGRARRLEYWSFLVFIVAGSFVASVADVMLEIVDDETGIGPLAALFQLAVILPAIAVLVRRLHDTNKSGWLVFLALIPILGSIILLILAIPDGDKGENRFGKDPKEEETAQ